MENVWVLAAIWVGLASIRAVARDMAEDFDRPHRMASARSPSWGLAPWPDQNRLARRATVSASWQARLLADTGAIVLTFLAGAELFGAKTLTS